MAMTRAMRLLTGCTAALLAAGALTGCGRTLAKAPAPTIAVPTKSPSRPTQARSDARALLTKVVLPKAVVPVSKLPGGLLSTPPQTPATPDLVDLHRLYVVGEPVATALAFVKAHQPAHTSVGTEGTSGTTTPPITTEWFIGFSWPPVGSVLNSRQVLVSLAALSSNRTAIRLDAEVTWLPAKPAGDLIPPGPDLLRAELSRGLNGEQGRGPTTTKDPAVIEAIRSRVNGLGVFPPGVMSCPADFGQELTLTFRWPASRHPAVVVTADVAGCQVVAVTRSGHEVQPELWVWDSSPSSSTRSAGRPENTDEAWGTRLRAAPSGTRPAMRGWRR